MFTEVLLGITAVLLIFWMLCKKPAGLPPGRWGLPLFGYIPLTKKSIDGHLLDFQKQYGDLYVWRIGTQVLLFAHDYHLARQILGSQDFMDRPDWNIFKANQETALGVAFSNDVIWQTNRKFVHRQLKDLGMGKSVLSGAVQAQALKVVEALKEVSGKPGPITPALNTAIVNVIWQMAANRQFEREDPRLLTFQKLVEEFTESSGPLILQDIFPWIKTVLPTSLINRLFRKNFFDTAAEKFFAYFKELVAEHRDSLDTSDPKDMIDAYLIEMEEKSEEHSGLRSEEDLCVLIMDMFFGGSDTTTNTAKWILLYLASYPDVQRKVQQEIDQSLPKGTEITIEDKSKLPYTEAVINEIIRKSSLSNTGLQHVASRDVHVAGFKIPKGTIAMASVASIHHDPRYWNKPERFLPERWLDSEGKFVMKKEGYLPFSAGKRNCIGESLARMELFIHTVTILQSFKISPPAGKMLDLTPDPNNPLGNTPRKQDVVFTIRD